MFPWLAGAIDIDIAKHIDHRTVLKQLDRVVTVYRHRAGCVVGYKPEEIIETGRFRGHIDKATCCCADRREGELLAVSATTIVGRADTVRTQVGNVIYNVDLYRFRNTARQWPVEHTGDDDILSEALW